MTNSLPCSKAVLADKVLLNLFGLMGGLYLVGVAALLCGLGISFYSAVCGVILGLLLTSLVPSAKHGWRAPAITLGLLVTVLFASGWFFDYSWDGLAIHKPGITQFLGGWNPYRDGSSQKGVEFWTAVYPKASWICGAQMAALGRSLECGKGMNLLAIAAAGLAAWRYLRVRLSAHPRIALTGAALLALNPVSVYQAPTSYVDGLLASFVTLLLFVLAHHLIRPTTPRAWFEIAITILFLANIKFTGLVYVCVILAVAAATCFYLLPIRTTVRFCGFAAVSVLIAVLVFGKSPYSDNLLAGRHFFYPLMGDESIDIIDVLKPANLARHDRFSSFLIGNFSKSEPVRAPASTACACLLIWAEYHGPAIGATSRPVVSARCMRRFFCWRGCFAWPVSLVGGSVSDHLEFFFSLPPWQAGSSTLRHGGHATHPSFSSLRCSSCLSHADHFPAPFA